MVLRVQAHGEDCRMSDKYPSGRLTCFPYDFKAIRFNSSSAPRFMQHVVILIFSHCFAGLFIPRQVSSIHIVDLTDNHSAERLGPDDHVPVPKLHSAAIISVHV